MKFGGVDQLAGVDIFIIVYTTLVVIWPLIVKYSTRTPIAVQTMSGNVIQVAPSIKILRRQKSLAFMTIGQIDIAKVATKTLDTMLTIFSSYDFVTPTFIYWYVGPPIRSPMYSILSMGSDVASASYKMMKEWKFNWLMCSVHKDINDAHCWECSIHKFLKSISDSNTVGSLFHGFIGIFTFFTRTVHRWFQWSVWVTILIGLNYIFTVLASASPDLQLYIQGSKKELNCMAHNQKVTIHFNIGFQFQVKEIAACFVNQSDFVKNYPMCEQFGKWDIYNKEFPRGCKKFTSLKLLSAKQCAGYVDNAVIMNVGTVLSENVISVSLHQHVLSDLASSTSFWTHESPTFMTCNPNINKNGDYISDKIELCNLFARTAYGLGSNIALALSIPIVFRFMKTVHHSIKQRNKSDDTTLVISLALQGQLLCLFCFHTLVAAFLPHAMCAKVSNLNLDVQAKWSTTLQENLEESFLKAFEALVFIAFEVVFTTLSVVLRVLLRMFMASFGEGTQPLVAFVTNVMTKPFECVMNTVVTVVVVSILVVAVTQLLCAISFNMMETCNFKVLMNNFFQFFFTGLEADLKFKICMPAIILMQSTCIKSIILIASGGTVPMYSRVLLCGYVLIIGVFDVADVILSTGFAESYVTEYFSCMKSTSTLFMFAHCGNPDIRNGMLIEHEVDIQELHKRDEKWSKINSKQLITLYLTYMSFMIIWAVISFLTPYEYGDSVLVRMCCVVFMWFAISTCSSDTEGCRKLIRFVIKEDSMSTGISNNTWVAHRQTQYPVQIDLPRTNEMANESTIAVFFCQIPMLKTESEALRAGLSVDDFSKKFTFVGASIKSGEKYEPVTLIPFMTDSKYRNLQLGMISSMMCNSHANFKTLKLLYLQDELQKLIQDKIKSS